MKRNIATASAAFAAGIAGFFIRTRQLASAYDEAGLHITPDPWGTALIALCAAAVILCTKEIAQRYTTQLVRFNSSFMSSGYFTGDTCEVNPEYGLARTCREIYEDSGVGPMDLNCIEMHDAYSPEEIVSYEQMLLCEPFESAKLIRSGDLEMGGRCPVNLSGGMLSQGHPLGASGARVVCDVTRQLRGQAPVEVQIKKRGAGMVQMVGGGRAGRSSEAVHVGILTI